MTRKDFVLIAASFADLLRIDAAMTADGQPARNYRDGVADAAKHLATALASTNPRFDRARFLAACGVS